jgi:ribosomal protein S27E
MDKKYAVIQASRIKRDVSSGLFDVKCKGTWYQVVVFGKTGSKINSERRSAILAKSLETDMNSSSSSSENGDNSDDADDDVNDDDNDGGNKGTDHDNDGGNKGNDGVEHFNQEVSDMVNSTSAMSLVDASELLIQPPPPPNLPNSSTNKSEYHQIMKALTNLSEAVGILSKDLQKSDQNSELAPIVKLFYID